MRSILVVFAGENLQVPVGRGLCAKYSCGKGFLFLTVGAVPRRSETASFSG